MLLFSVNWKVVTNRLERASDAAATNWEDADGCALADLGPTPALIRNLTRHSTRKREAGGQGWQPPSTGDCHP